ncbi:MAG: hypothetical protein JWM19_1557 [Actinomycetia bacterium]|nr:hypothetical protein [Actinomycetes bacterium]
MTWYPPGGLPAGQFITPDSRFSGGAPGLEHALWVTDEPVPDAGGLWGRLLRERVDTGLWPLLLLTMRPRGAALELMEARGAPGELRIGQLSRRPWHSGEFGPVPAGPVDALDAAEILARWWGEVTGGDDGQSCMVPPWQPFRRWPGLAPAGPGSPAAGDAAADGFAADLAAAPGGTELLTGRDSGIHIGLVQAADGAAALAACGFMSRRGQTAEDAAVIRSWQDRFGARLCAVGHDCLALSVASPPVSPEHCLRVGAEHLAYETREALVDGIDTPLSFEEYAARLSGSSTWWFWWD